MTEFSGNRGEWSEPYVLLKLLADGELALGDSRLNKIEGLILPILTILREEKSQKYSYSDNKKNVVIELTGTGAFQISVDEFKEKAEFLLARIKAGTGNEKKGSFSIPEIEGFLRRIGCTKLSEKSQSKTDIHIVVHDVRTGLCPLLGFSVKSELGSKATLFNASRATNFTFEIPNWNNEFTDLVNNINDKNKVQKRLANIRKRGFDLKFSHVDNSIFRNNLMLIDSKMSEILVEMINAYYSGKASSVSELTQTVCAINPNGYDKQHKHQFYTYKIKRFLNDSALGMRAAEVWQGKYDATGGYLVVKDDGEIICYHIYSRNEFEDYLFFNTKFDTPSTSKHNFARVYEEDGKFFFKLNFQIKI
ncbi:HpaII family restriction endonuclease [Neisseria lisongii]|uniref:HpaII family restriction endonuclease n=1 Tax=Neisseria lisongii TaxID=2912188 RepID=A0AAW5ALP3_9NEIS|nr:HpaII family restriction endonuclease [Neisseria lisongii]MCF7530441.1 HpaII family restriction endonuclease [Neisseria lisongii]